MATGPNRGQSFAVVGDRRYNERPGLRSPGGTSLLGARGEPLRRPYIEICSCIQVVGCGGVLAERRLFLGSCFNSRRARTYSRIARDPALFYVCGLGSPGAAAGTSQPREKAARDLRVRAGKLAWPDWAIGNEITPNITSQGVPRCNELGYAVIRWQYFTTEG